MNYRQRLIDAAEAAEFAAKLDAGIAKEVEKLGYVRVHKVCLEKLKAEIERLKADRDTWEATCQTVDKKLQRAKAEIERLNSMIDELTENDDG